MTRRVHSEPGLPSAEPPPENTMTNAAVPEDQKPNGKKQYRISSWPNSVSHHDGVSAHTDGSRFSGITICRNNKEMKRFIKKLILDGYEEEMFVL